MVNDLNIKNTPSGYTFVGLFRKAVAQKMNPNLFIKLQPAYDNNGRPLSSEWFAVYQSKDPTGFATSFAKFTQNFV